jgi:GT2 family glycosyltransferase
MHMTASLITSSVLIPSYRRGPLLESCLRALARQTLEPEEVIVAWQGEDTPTRDKAEELGRALSLAVRVVHVPEPGVVAAENAALDCATGQVILLIDDDAVAPPGWVERHLAHYKDPTVGAVGGPADNHDGQGNRHPIRAADPFGEITWYGRVIGNMHDQPPEWRNRPARDVTHLVGYNMSLRRAAFDRFETGLKRYWQMFEADACLQVRANGYRVRFDPGIVVEHGAGIYSAGAYVPDRTTDLETRVANASYNTGFVLSKHTRGPLRWVRWLYLLGVGTVWLPGPMLLPLSIRRFGHPARELFVARMTWASKHAGWCAGRRAQHARARKTKDSSPGNGALQEAPRPDHEVAR